LDAEPVGEPGASSAIGSGRRGPGWTTRQRSRRRARARGRRVGRRRRRRSGRGPGGVGR
jgi:hypothetical protein